ncbi:MAG: RBBP9/YdeN family alpha/beta hydrolase [Gammaproteobacteria bacterium]
MKVLILPGIGNSGPDHWQTHWEKLHPEYTRVIQDDWNNPECAKWLTCLEKAVSLSGPDTVVIAHSLACLLVAHWATSTHLRIKAALLVAVPNPIAPSFPTQAVGFSPLPNQPLPFQSTVVASSNDPYGNLAHAEQCAAVWGSNLVNIGEAGHINAASGLGAWHDGHKLLQQLLV